MCWSLVAPHLGEMGEDPLTLAMEFSKEKEDLDLAFQQKGTLREGEGVHQGNIRALITRGTRCQRAPRLPVFPPGSYPQNINQSLSLSQTRTHLIGFPWPKLNSSEFLLVPFLPQFRRSITLPEHTV